jgi:multidrug transporter EmrE-like cation transporter
MSNDSPSRPSFAVAAGALALSIAFGVSGQLLMKWAALRTVGVQLDLGLLFPVALALGVYSLGIVAWMVALRDLRLSIAYPLTSLNYVGILAGSYYWFGERISIARVTGVILIFLGVLLVAVFGRNRSEDRTGE